MYDIETGASKLAIVLPVQCSCGTSGYLDPRLTAYFRHRFDDAFPFTDPDVAAFASREESQVPASLLGRARQIGNDILEHRQLSRRWAQIWGLTYLTVDAWSSPLFKVMEERDGPDCFIGPFLDAAGDDVSRYAAMLEDAAEDMTQDLRRLRPSQIIYTQGEHAIRRSLEHTFQDMVDNLNLSRWRHNSLHCVTSCNVVHARHIGSSRAGWSNAQFFIVSGGTLSLREAVRDNLRQKYTPRCHWEADASEPQTVPRDGRVLILAAPVGNGSTSLPKAAQRLGVRAL